ncbi:elongator complex protein 6-like [Limulus polyphemus]|uniref:Elongator complex protein 6 n=1 Tax=Limulus polyphemus TaxID=6850 RepID=A0ABM1BEY6_LIMPO|nr:elongator complex protein 6-like [Limulus polyphemus]
MFSDLNVFLECEKNLPKRKFILVTNDHRSDSSFVLHNMISLFLKNSCPVILVNIAQSFNHYHNVALKLGINLKKVVEEGKLLCVDGLKLLNALIESYFEEQNCLNNPFSFIMNCREHSLMELYLSIKKKVEMLDNSSTKDLNFLILIDDFSNLQSLGASNIEVINFINYCHSLILRKTGGCLVIGGSVDFDDEDSHVLLNCISHSSDTCIQINGLLTGQSRDVDGEITVTEKSGKLSKKIMQFKVEEKSVRLFARGTCSAVL